MTDAADKEAALKELEKMAERKRAKHKPRTPEQKAKMSLSQRIRWAEHWKKQRGTDETEEG